MMGVEGSSLNIVDIPEKKIAMLIDGDNANHKLIEKELSEVEKYGNITIKRVYGDFSKPQLKPWEEVSKTYAFTPIQQYNYKKGKNATDNALTIEAMDILHRKLVDGFCIVSSDSDFTRLVTRIREEGIFVLGIGEKDTITSLINACDRFIFCENLSPELFKEKVVPKKVVPKKVEKVKSEEDPLLMLMEAFNRGVGEDGTILLAYLGDLLLRKDPSFDPRNYKHGSLGALIKSYPKIFGIYMPDKNAPQKIFVKLRDKK